jgi:DNA processing protein
LGILVIEAALQSGSLITARLGAEQGREVFAIPGSIHNPLARGCHRLIREGAKLVEAAQDILEELGPLIGATTELQPKEEPRETHASACDPEYQLLLDSLGYDPLPIDILVERCGLTAEAVSSMLLVLELQGLITALPGGRYFRCGKEGQS